MLRADEECDTRRRHAAGGKRRDRGRAQRKDGKLADGDSIGYRAHQRCEREGRIVRDSLGQPVEYRHGDYPNQKSAHAERRGNHNEKTCLPNRQTLAQRTYQCRGMDPPIQCGASDGIRRKVQPTRGRQKDAKDRKQCEMPAVENMLPVHRWGLPKRGRICDS